MPQEGQWDMAIAKRQSTVGLSSMKWHIKATTFPRVENVLVPNMYDLILMLLVPRSVVGYEAIASCGKADIKWNHAVIGLICHV